MVAARYRCSATLRATRRVLCGENAIARFRPYRNFAVYYRTELIFSLENALRPQTRYRAEEDSEVEIYHSSGCASQTLTYGLKLQHLHQKNNKTNTQSRELCRR